MVKIVATVTDSDPPKLVRRARHLGANLLEARIDRFRSLDKDKVFEKIRSLKKSRLPIIATIRSKKEGGGRTLSDSKRLELFQKILPQVSAIDIELSSPRLIKTLVPLAHRRGKKTILSYHNFKSTPSERALEGILRRGKKMGGDMVKIATWAKNPGDTARLLLFTHRNRNQNLISIAMGPRGILSRTLGPLFGSLLTYGYLTRPQAPGQISVASLSGEMKNLFPKGFSSLGSSARIIGSHGPRGI
ncbi:MAG: type I 3-dehydroquinate dehydratase [Candidatus Omnitrophica bacterium]|nr:type I 3-dehydroquinate dehydratase [Candidatus Omnitrophota bacterium]